MKLHMSKDWVRKFEDSDIEEPPCGVMACSPFIYAHGQLSRYALISPFAEHLKWLYECERDHPRIEEDRLCWAVNRLQRYLKRQNPCFEGDSMTAWVEKVAEFNQLAPTVDLLTKLTYYIRITGLTPNNL